MDKSEKTSLPQTTRSRIMAAASELFSQKGYAATTTRAIAEMAGINEVTLFRHFGSKENLVREIMDQFGGMAVAGNLTSRLSGDYRQDLLMIGTTLLQVMTERNSAMRMAICEAGNFPEFRDVVAENPRQLRSMLSRYFTSLMESDQIHPGHPELLAQAFLGMFFSYSVLQGFLLDNLEPEPAPTLVVEGFVDLFIRGTLIHEE